MAVTINDSSNGGGSGGPAGPTGPAGPAGPSFVQKSGIVPALSFAGSPKKFSIVFSAAYADDLFAVSVDGVDARDFTYESKTAAGFTINTNANTAPTNEVSWVTIPAGETS